MADGVSIEGVDYAWSRPSPGSLARAGKVFACRYGGPGTSGKHLTLTEAQALSAAGISVVANAEGAADGLLGGFTAGESWARSAEAHFKACGMPPGRPIYLSADFDVTPTQWPTVANALKGAASVLGANRVGVYGSYDVMVWARRDRVAAWFWQTYAWSDDRWAAGNHLEQYRNGVTIDGVGNIDLDRALTSDYGQWKTGDDMGWEEKPAGSTFSYGEIALGTNIAVWKVVGMLEAIGPKVGIDADELAEIKAAAKAGTLDAAPGLVAAIVAELPDGVDLTKADVQAAAEAAVRKVLGSVDGPQG